MLRTDNNQSKCRATATTVNQFHRLYKSVRQRASRNDLENCRSYGIPEMFVSLLRNIYHESSCCVHTDSGISDSFEIKTGVRQGLVISPFLFVLAVDFILRHTLRDREHGVQGHDGRQIADLDFADDILLLRSTQRSICDLTTMLENEASKIGLQISAAKSKVMRLG